MSSHEYPEVLDRSLVGTYPAAAVAGGGNVVIQREFIDERRRASIDT